MNRGLILILLAVVGVELAACGKREKPIDPVSARIVEEAVRLKIKKPTGEITDADRQRVTNLELSGAALTDLRPLVQYPQLEGLVLIDCPGVSNLKPLSKLPQLETLRLNICNGVSDLRPLIGVQNLRIFVLEGCPAVKQIPKSLWEKGDIVWERRLFAAPTPVPSSPPAI